MTAVPAHRVVRAASAVLLAGALAACGPLVAPAATTPASAGPSAPTPVAPGDAGRPLQMLALLGQPGDMRLVWLDGDLRLSIPVPERDLRWASGSAARGLVVTAGPDGRILATEPFAVGERPGWREIPIDPAARRWLGRPVAVAVADPASDAIAAIAADPGSGSADGHLAILGRAGGPVRTILFPGRWDGRAPAWLDSGHIAISTRDLADSTGLAIVDLASGDAVRRGDAVGAFAVSGDGRALARQDRDDRIVHVGATDALLAGEPPDPREALPVDPGSRLAAQLLLDATGRRLAVAWLDDAGDTTGYSTYEQGTGGWALVRSGVLPRGTSRAILISLGP